MARKDPLKGIPQIGEKKLKQLITTARRTYKETRKASGELGEAISAAIEHDHLHRKAFAFIKAADRMEPEALAEYWHTLQLYMDMAGLTERVDSVPALKLVHDAEKADKKEEPQTVAAE